MPVSRGNAFAPPPPHRLFRRVIDRAAQLMLVTSPQAMRYRNTTCRVPCWVAPGSTAGLVSVRPPMPEETMILRPRTPIHRDNGGIRPHHVAAASSYLVVFGLCLRAGRVFDAAVSPIGSHVASVRREPREGISAFGRHSRLELVLEEQVEEVVDASRQDELPARVTHDLLDGLAVTGVVAMVGAVLARRLG